MPLEIRSMQVGQIEGKNATVELVVSDNAVEDKAVEILRIRMLIDVKQDSYLPALQVAAMTKARKLLEGLEGDLKRSWNIF